MKIAFIAYDLPGYFGGPIVNARRLLPELRRRGHAVHALILYRGAGSPSAALLRRQGVIVDTAPFHPWTEDRIDWLLDCLVRIQPDVFVPNLSVAGWFAARWARAAGIPTVAAYRSDDALHAAMVDTFVLGEPCWAVSGMVSVNQAACEKVAASKPAHTRLCTIPSGVPVPTKAADQRAGNELRIIYVGRLVQEQKRILDTIDALAMALEILPGATATLIGHGRNRSDEAAVDCRIDERGMSNRIIRMGTVEPDCLHEVLIQFHVLVLLSDYEGTPGSVMDGMACGLVPVCLDIPGGVRELVKHKQTGLLVTDRKEAFVSAIKRLASDTALREHLGANARAHVGKGYSLAVAADRWEIFFEKLLSDSRPRRPVAKPKRYELPPVNPGLAREDHRRPGILKRTCVRVHRTLGALQTARKGNEGTTAAFLRPVASLISMDRYLARQGIVEALTAQLQNFHGTVLDVGCGHMPYKGLFNAPGSKVKQYLGLDFSMNPVHKNKPDLCWQDGCIPLADNSVDAALCTEVLEHCPEPAAVLSEVARVLHQDGFLFFTVPFFWPLHEVPYDHCRYTPFALRRLLSTAGFNKIEIWAAGGWDASLAQMIGLWVRRRPMSRMRRNILSVLLFPFYKLLVHCDTPEKVNFTESQMLTGVWGTARKAGKPGGCRP